VSGGQSVADTAPATGRTPPRSVTGQGTWHRRQDRGRIQL